MKVIKPYIIIIILGTGIGLFLSLTLISKLDTLLKIPKFESFIKSEIEEIPLNGQRETYKSFVQAIDSNNLIKNSSEHIFELLEAEQLIHASDFENEMASFYKKILQLREKDTLLRILHFGDSQVEGDRITGVLRDKMQKEFGGCGIGYIPISETMVHRLNIKKEVEGWKKYKLFGQEQKAPHNKYGFTGYVHEVDSQEIFATVALSPKPRYYNRTKKIEQLSILYKGVQTDSIFEVTGNNPITSSIIRFSKDVKVQSWDINGYANSSLKIKVKKNDSLNVYGLALDCNKGIAVDNIAMRGSSGVEFTKNNRENLKNQFSLLNVGLVIYQFGVNVIPFVLEDYTFYENMVYSQLRLLRELLPNASVLVVGVSDMARKEEGQYLSYPNIGKVKQAQQNAAKRAGCAFWDLHAVMGGENAIKEWVVASPPLAEKDYTHFNISGAKLVGDKLFQALMSDFQSFKKAGAN